ATQSTSSALERLRRRVRGSVSVPGADGYDQGRMAWNLAVDQRPSVVVMAAAEADIVAAVDFARDQNLGIAVQGSGHGVAVPSDGGVLINTSQMKSVLV